VHLEQGLNQSFTICSPDADQDLSRFLSTIEKAGLLLAGNKLAPGNTETFEKCKCLSLNSGKKGHYAKVLYF